MDIITQLISMWTDKPKELLEDLAQNGYRIKKEEKKEDRHIIQAWFDGNGNAQMTGLAQFRIYFPGGEIVPSSTAYEKKTNNELEYQGLINLLGALMTSASLSHIDNRAKTRVIIMGDSQLVVNQVNGLWRVKEQHLVPLRDMAISLLSKARQLYGVVELKWVSSKENLCDSHS